MLYISLVVSALLLVAVNIIAYLSRRAPFGMALAGLFGSFVLPFSCMVFLPAVALQAMLLCFTVPMWQASCRGLDRLRILSFFATCIAYLLVSLYVWYSQDEISRLRQMFPYESIVDRVPLLPLEKGDIKLKNNDELEDIEALIGREQGGYFSRSYRLEQLHERSVKHFVNSPGFGVARTFGSPNEYNLTFGLRSEPALNQPISFTPSHYAEDSLEHRKREDSSLSGLHRDSVIDFVHPRGFGYAKDRNHVAGFQTHGFSKVPDASGNWRVGQIELVSLLEHPEPVVYVSEHLPRMDELKREPTRSLDTIEKDGLAALRQGEDLFIRGERMVGSIRSSKQCVSCHGGNRGQLLGAFSYIFDAQ